MFKRENFSPALGILIVLFLFVSQVLSQERIKSVQICRTEEPPKIDGQIEDSCWKNIQPISGFFQHDPVNGAAASEETLVWIAYDNKNIYFAFLMKDSQADKIWAELTPRNDYEENDSISVILDTYNDKRTSISFEVNPKGVQKNSVETIWKSDAVLRSDGWTAEMAIPFKSLRFSPKEDQVWGINFERYVHRLNETDYWTNVSRDKPLLQQMGELRGLSGIRPGYNIEFFPYLGFRMLRWRDEKEEKVAAGLDFKYGILPNLILDLTASPNFSEVESDPFIFQLAPYENYLEENRPFFTEGSQYFIVSSGEDYHESQESLFYSRRINNPKFAAKLSGKTRGYSFGILGAVNDEEEGADKIFSVVRVQKDIFSNSQIGIYCAGMNMSQDYNQNFGFDYNFNFKDFYYVRGQSVITFNRYSKKENNAMHTLSFRREPDAGLQMNFNFRRIEENVSVRTGFVSQTDIQSTNLEWGYAWRYNRGKIKHWSLSLAGNLEQDSHGEITGKSLEVGSWIDFFSRLEFFWRFETGESKYQVYDESGELAWTKNYLNTYDGGLDLSWFRGGFLKDISFELNWEKGGIYNRDFTDVEPGTQTNVETSLTLRPRSNFEFSFESDWTQQRIERSGEKVFDGMTYATSLHYQLTRSLFLSTRLKGETREDQYNFDLLFGYYFGAGNIVQLCYKKNVKKLDLLREKGYEITLKVSYLLRI